MEELLKTITNGDIVKRIDDSIIIEFKGKRKVLSSSIYNGGYREDLQAVFNHYLNPKTTTHSLKGYKEELTRLCLEFGYEPARVCAIGTGVEMKDVSVQDEIYDDVELLVLVTAGAEGNAGRVGDFAPYSGRIEKMLPPGTINTIVYFVTDVMPAIMARAIVTATEAKTAALQELMLGSEYSSGLATGTGTDQIIIIADSTGKYLVNDCGKHTKTGELVGRLVKKAVLDALEKRNGFNGERMHDILRRVRRYRITARKIQASYLEKYHKNITMEKTLALLDDMSKDRHTVLDTSLYLHLLDQYTWGLLGKEELLVGGTKLLQKELQLPLDVQTKEDFLNFMVTQLQEKYASDMYDLIFSN